VEDSRGGRLDSASDLARRAFERLSWRLVDIRFTNIEPLSATFEQRAIGAANRLLRPSARMPDEIHPIFQLSGGRAVGADRSRHQVVETRLQAKQSLIGTEKSAPIRPPELPVKPPQMRPSAPLQKWWPLVERVLVDRRISDRVIRTLAPVAVDENDWLLSRAANQKPI